MTHPAQSESPDRREGSPIPTPRAHGARPAHILACVAQSALSEAALPCAAFLARAFGAEITLLCVMQPPRENPGQASPDALLWEIGRQDASAYLERLQKALATQVCQPIAIRVEQGQPATRIQAVARELGSNVIVLGAAGEGDAAWALGTTAQQVLAHAEGSVLVARGSGAQDRFVPRRVLVPLDGSARAESALPTVARIAAFTAADVILAHVVPEPLPSSVLHAPEDVEMARALALRLEAQGRSYLEHIRHAFRRDITVHVAVHRHADPAEHLCELAESEQADLVLLSAHGSTGSRARPLGSVATHLLGRLSMPLLMLQDLAGCEVSQAGDPAVDVASAVRPVPATRNEA